ncbi:MAG: hypothetical protein FJY65_08465 [Calditrichaeota bacterium]|nr:hypothetical protein [Calditrichota bacterium]
MKEHEIFLIAALGLFIIIGCGGGGKNPVGGSDPRRAPIAPSNLFASMGPGGEVVLIWKDNSDNEDGFECYESVGNDSNFVRIALTRSNEDTLALPSRSPRQSYYYKVRAYNAYGYSVFTDQVVVRGGSLWKTFPTMEGTFRCVDYFGGSRYLLSGSGDHIVRIWDTYSLRAIKTMSGHRHAVQSVQYNPMHTVIVSASPESRQVIVWDADGGGVLAELRGTFARFCSDGNHLAVLDSSVRMYSGTGLGEPTLVERYWGKWFDFDVEGRFLFIVQADSIRKIRVSDLTLEAVYKPRGFQSSNAYALSPDGNYIAQAQGRRVKVWRLEDGAAIADMGEHGRPIQTITFSPDGLWIASGAQDMQIIIWEIATGTALWWLSGHTNSVYGLDFTVDGSMLASASGDCTIRVWGPFK